MKQLIIGHFYSFKNQGLQQRQKRSLHKVNEHFAEEA